MLTKEEMERVWNEEPVGYLKKIKKKNKYQVTYQSVKVVKSEPKTKEVWLEKRQDAQWSNRIANPEEGYDYVTVTSVIQLTK